MLEAMDAAAVRRWCTLAVAEMRRHEQELNDLNVYPVPDGDTGTNLLLTLQSAEHGLHDATVLKTAGDALRTMARGALMGARGNSGVITAQWLAGLAAGIAAIGPGPSAETSPSPADEPASSPAGGAASAAGGLVAGDGGLYAVLGPPVLSRVLQRAADAAYEAVAHPVEGTILSVARAASGATIRECADAAAVALSKTPDQLPILAAAGVVDAGGRGLVLLLDALVEALTGAPSSHDVEVVVGHTQQSIAATYRGPAYEVQFLIDTDQEAAGKLRAALDRLGDSLVIVGGDPSWRVHVHVDDAGAAVEAALEAGRPYQIQVTHLTSSRSEAGPRRPDPTARAVVVTAAGDGIEALLVREGAVPVKANPSTSEILDAILATGAGRVAVLPTDANLRAVAQTAADEAFGEGVKVRVIPTRSPVQALAALAVRDPSRRFEDDVIAMAEAAAACRSAEVTVASREAITVAGRCLPGDVIALVEGEVNVIGKDLEAVCRELLDRMLATGRNELVTMLTGADAPPGLAGLLTEHLREHWPFVEVHAYQGGQVHYPLLVGVE